LSPDPIGPKGGMNSYGYGAGNPANLSDRSGLVPNLCPGGNPATGEGCQFGWNEWVSVVDRAPLVWLFDRPAQIPVGGDPFGGVGGPTDPGAGLPNVPQVTVPTLMPDDVVPEPTVNQVAEDAAEEAVSAAEGDGAADTAGSTATSSTSPGPSPFRDPCSVGFGGRFEDSAAYILHSAGGVALEAYHAAELGLIGSTAIVPAAYASTAVRTGTWPTIIFTFGTTGASGAASRFTHRAFPFVAAATGAVIFSAAVDAAASGCQ